MAFLRARQREIAVVVVLVLVIWVRQLMVGEMYEEINKLASAQGLPAKRQTLAKVKQAEKDAQDVSTRMDAIRRQPLPGVNLAATMERFHSQRQIPPSRSRLAPRAAQAVEGGLTEESLDVTVNAMTLEEVVEYLASLEQLGPSIRLRTMKMQKTNDTLTLSLVVAALRPQ